MTRWLLLFPCLMAPLHAEVLQVNPAVGMKTIQERVRAKIAAGLSEDLHVAFESGMYRLQKPWVMDQRDSDPRFRVIYRKARPEDPLCIVAISGGVPIRDWREEADGTWTAPIPRGVGVPREMFHGVTRLPRARYPDEGWLRVEKVGEDRRTNFQWKEGDLHGKDLVGAELVFLHDWSMSRIEIAAIDPRERRLTLRHPVGCAAKHYAMDHFEKQARYAIEGHPSLIDRPGEWAVDEGRIRYLPRQEQQIGDFEPTIPRLKQLIQIQGTVDKPLSGIDFEGLLFAHCGWEPPAGGYASGQATIHEQRDAEPASKRVMMAAAVSLDHVHHFQFRKCEFLMLGGSGLWLRRNCLDGYLEDLKFHDISGNGLMLGDVADHGPGEVTRKVTVERCVIEDCGVQYHGAVGIWAGFARELVIVNNSLSDLPYTGISLGWRWNAEPSSAGGNRVLDNHIHRVMQVLSDGGAIYTLGFQPDSTLHGNHIHDIPTNAGRAESNGMFLDQGSKGFTIENNLIHGVAKSPLRFHQAKENIVMNNRWQLTAGTPGIRYNNSREEDILQEGNVVLDDKALAKARREWMEKFLRR